MKTVFILLVALLSANMVLAISSDSSVISTTVQIKSVIEPSSYIEMDTVYYKAESGRIMMLTQEKKISITQKYNGSVVNETGDDLSLKEVREIIGNDGRVLGIFPHSLLSFPTTWRMVCYYYFVSNPLGSTKVISRRFILGGDGSDKLDKPFIIIAWLIPLILIILLGITIKSYALFHECMIYFGIILVLTILLNLLLIWAFGLQSFIFGLILTIVMIVVIINIFPLDTSGLPKVLAVILYLYVGIVVFELASISVPLTGTSVVAWEYLVVALSLYVVGLLVLSIKLLVNKAKDKNKRSSANPII